MENKKQDQSTPAMRQATAAKKMKVRDWIESIKQEIRTIHWTSKEELKVYTQIVVGATFVFGMGVYLVDLVIHSVLQGLTWAARMLVG